MVCKLSDTKLYDPDPELELGPRIGYRIRFHHIYTVKEKGDSSPGKVLELCTWVLELNLIRLEVINCN